MDLSALRGVDTYRKRADANAPCEAAALRYWNGRGAVHLLSEEADNVLVMERAIPGQQLADLAMTDDRSATLAAARVIAALWETTDVRGCAAGVSA